MTIDRRGSGFPRGSGTVTIRRGTPTTINFQGTTADGAQIRADIRCNQVLGN